MYFPIFGNTRARLKPVIEIMSLLLGNRDSLASNHQKLKGKINILLLTYYQIVAKDTPRVYGNWTERLGLTDNDDDVP